jgi:type I restriction enzyme S subunit
VPWRESSLGEVLTLKRGYDLPEHQRSSGTIPIVSSSGITGLHSHPKVKGPGVVTGRYGTLGQVFYLDQDFWPLNTSLYVADFKGNDVRFVAYLLQTLQFGLQNVAGAVPGVNRNNLHQMCVRVPPIPTQRKIASILSAHDDLIENNLRRIRILEEMAQSLYKEWFVDFHFPGHENVKMVDSSTGPIPEGWGSSTIASVCSGFIDGDWIESKDQGGEDYRLLQVSNIGLNRFMETGTFRYITSATLGRLRCTEVLPGDILISRMPEPIGRAWYVRQMPWRMVTAVDVAIARPNPEVVDPFYYLHHLNSPDHIDRCQLRATGTTRARVARRVMAELPIIVPPRDLQDRYGAMADAANHLANVLLRQNDALRQTRDLLLPKLISGEIDVSDLDIGVGEDAA